MATTRPWMGACALLLAASACESKREAVGEGAESPPPAPAGPVLSPQPEDVEIERFGGDGPVKARLQLPAKWEPFVGGTARWRPAGTRGLFGPSIELSVSCGGLCDAAKIPDNIDRELAGFVDSSARPDLNFGDAERDAIRATVEKRGEGALPAGGKWMAVRITYPKDIKDAAMYKAKLSAVAFHHPAGEDFYLLARAAAPLEEEKGAWPSMVASIQTLALAE